MPNDLPPWPAVYQQTQRWLAVGCFEAIVHDLRVLLRLAAGRAVERSFAWKTRFRRVVRDYERLTTTLAGLHWVPSRASCFIVLCRSSLKVHNRL